MAVTLVLGGARSGKTSYALDLVRRLAGDRSEKTMIATAVAGDDEMRVRIARHQDERDSSWRTIEEPFDLPGAIDGAAGSVMLVDCLTLWLSNLLGDDRDVELAVDVLLRKLGEGGREIVLISNEVGLGIVPDNALARRFRDEAGRLHQRIAVLADRVVFVIAGLPMILKGGAA